MKDDGLHHKIDKISEDITDIKVNMAGINSTLSSQKDSLDHHIKRTDLLEQRMEKLPYKLLAAIATLITILGTIKHFF